MVSGGVVVIFSLAVVHSFMHLFSSCLLYVCPVVMQLILFVPLTGVHVLLLVSSFFGSLIGSFLSSSTPMSCCAVVVGVVSFVVSCVVGCVVVAVGDGV